MDDARTELPARRLSAFALVLALLTGGAAGVLVALRFAPPEWPRYEVRTGGLIERGADLDALRARVRRRYGNDEAGAGAMQALRRSLRAQLAAAIPAGPLPPLSPGAECAARLRALGRVLRGLERGAPLDRSEFASGFSSEAADFETIRAAASAHDVAALDAALGADLSGWSGALRDRAAGLDARERARLWPEWLRGLRARAEGLESAATDLEVAEPAPMREAVGSHVALRALLIEPAVPDPSTILSEFPVAPSALDVRLLPGFWAGSAAAGGVIGLLLLAGLAPLARRRRQAPLPTSPAFDPAVPDAWLHLVIGDDRPRMVRAVLELAAHPIAARRRVAVVDASRRGRLHEALDLSPQLGFSDCAAEGLPALGLIQSGAFSGLFLLSRGRRGRIRNWLALDRVVEELRPNFERVVVVFDARIPAVVGGVLAGRWMRGWWSGPGPARGRKAARVAAGLAIVPHDMNLEPMPQPTLEALEARLTALAGVVSLAPLPDAGWVSEQGPIRVSPPTVLESDLQIRQKLRFLAWMRRMRAERESTTGAARDPD